MTGPDRRPSRYGAGLSLGAGALAVAALWAFSSAGAVVAGLGWACLLGGVVRSSRRLVTAWFLGLWLGALVGTAGALPPAVTGFVVLAGVVSWDAGQRAVGLGRTLTREADTRRVETLHAGATAAVGGLTLAVAYGAFVLGRGVNSRLAVLSLVVAVTCLLYVLDRLRGRV